jgi:integrase
MPKRGSSQHPAPLSPDVSLQRAGQAYLARRKQYLKARSIENYECHFRFLVKYFGPNKRLSTFHEGDLRGYQKWRAQGGEGRRKAGSSCINHELGALTQLLELADLWQPIQKYYEPIPEPDWVPPRALSAEEEERFFRFASKKPEWKTAYHSAVITSNTTIAGCELRALRLEHLYLGRTPPVIHVPRPVKNKNRIRAVPLNEVALASFRQLVRLAKERGSCQPGHYLIPYRVKLGTYDPNRSASPNFIRSSFRRIARSCGLGWVTPRSFRHQAITKLLEGGAPDETVRAIAGQVSEKTMRYYSHIRIEAKKSAVDRLLPRSPKPVAAERGNVHRLSAGVKQIAKRLGIRTEAALELILQYESLRTGAKSG